MQKYRTFFKISFLSYPQILKPILLRLGHAVAQLLEALRHRPEGRGFDSRRCHWNFSLT